MPSTIESSSTVHRCEAVHCFDVAAVRFAIYPDGYDGPRILAEISEDALRDLFGARDGGDSLVDACQAHFDLIESQALALHRASPLTRVKLGLNDFSWPVATREVTGHYRGAES